MITREVRNLELQTCFGIHFKLSRFRLLGYNHDNAISSFTSVDSRGCGIFQDIDAFYLLIVIVHKLRERDFETIHDDQWCVGVILLTRVESLDTGWQRRVATDIDVRQVVWIRSINIVESKVDTGICILQCLQEVLTTELLELLLADRAHATSVAFLRFAEDTRHHHITQGLGILLHRDRHLFLQGYDTCLHAYIAHLHLLCPFEVIVKRKGSVEVRYCHDLCP